ncbi:MAG: hypothetical protein IKG65_03925 [Exiguobacterium sp.]|nr:hypothetical protein [Exiguobacterium sp.]MBR2681479.1 hypothetical protein [Exiguobacterium sp.]MBR2758796.1 hypothetical protein [Exiguobacterium sp.]MBR3061566.1 hypothetical protein [Exiguobacterium sp.]MBR3215285.1 hypothetical protein [Exiguobacterium sp.]
MEWSYWKAVVRYGHVGKRKEISVARYLVMPEYSTMIDVMNVIDQMPGTKNRAMISLRRVDVLEYLEGIRDEKENFFLQRLFEGKQAQ